MKYEFKGTPAPWSLNHLITRSTIFVESKEGTICRTFNDDISSNAYTHNAYLIAASPLLLQACIDVFEQVEHYPEILGNDTMTQLQQAIHAALNIEG